MPKPRRLGLAVVTRPGTSTLYLRGTVAGRSIYESAGTDLPELAEERRAVREAQIYRQQLHGAPDRITFAAAVSSYLTASPQGDGTQLRLNKLIRHFGPTLTCDQIDQARLDRAANTILRPGYQPTTKLREITTPLRAVLTHAAKRRWCDLPAFESAPSSPARTVWLSPAEVDALTAAAAAHLQALFIFLTATGARLSEALSLAWDDVDFTERRAWLRDVKDRQAGRDRLVQLCPRAVFALAALSHRDGAVFRTRGRTVRVRGDRVLIAGAPYIDRDGLSGGQIKTAWATALKAAKITKPATPHSLRHTWASWHYAEHRDLLLLKRDGDWSSVSLVERYAHLVPSSLAKQIIAWRQLGSTKSVQADNSASSTY